MKRTSLCFLLVAAGASLCAAEPPHDLTDGSKKDFAANLGQVVTLRGKLLNGVHGHTLHMRTHTVAFYVVPELTSSGKLSNAKLWTQLENTPVQLTGKLYFRSFPRPLKDANGLSIQLPPDYYYMIQKEADIRECYVPKPEPTASTPNDT